MRRSHHTNRLLNMDDRGRILPQANHPVVRTHPVTGRRARYVNRGFTYRINEVPEEESDRVAAADVSAIGPAPRGVRWGSGTVVEIPQQAGQFAHRIIAVPPVPAAGVGC